MVALPQHHFRTTAHSRANVCSGDEYDADLNLAIPPTDDPRGVLCLDISKFVSGGGINGGIVNYAIHWPRPVPACAKYWMKADCNRSTRNQLSQTQLSSGHDGLLNSRLIWPKFVNTSIDGATCINSTLDAGAAFMIAPRGMMFFWNKKDCSHISRIYDGNDY